MSGLAWLRIVTLLAAALGALAAAAGLFWTPPGDMPAATDLYGEGLYRRDTPFTAGGAQGADLLSLLGVAPAALWALMRLPARTARLVVAASHAWWLYLGGSLALGAVTFNEAFPLYVAMMSVSTVGLALALPDLGAPRPPRFLAAFLIGCGLVTGQAWALLLWLEMAAGAYPSAAYYTVRTTYAIDLGIIAPGCLAAGVALLMGWRWWLILAVPLLAIAALLLPMMALQTVMQLRAGVAFGPEAAAPFAGFLLVSAGAIYFLWCLARKVP
jgi:hypothetical protein